MARRIQIPIVGSTATSKAVDVSNQETLNLVNIINGEGAKARVTLENAPGLADLGAIGDGPCRTPKMVNWKGDLYGVFGTKVMQLEPTGGVNELGTIGSTTGTVTMARGRNQLALVTGDEGWYWDGTTLTQITNLAFPPNQTPAGVSTHIVYMDGFFIVNDANTDNFYISALEDAASWNALDFDAASVAPDNSLAIANTESILYILGDETVQPYYNNGNPDFPYAVILNAVQEVGIMAPYSLAETDDGLFWLGRTPEGGLFVYRMIGTSGQVISNEEQEQALSEISDPTTATGFIYTRKNNRYYVLQLGAGELTLVYNINAGTWETRALNDGSAWRAAGHGMLGRRNIIGSRLQALHHELDDSVYTDSGSPIVRRRRTAVAHANEHLMDFFCLTVDVQAGVGNPTDPGSDPQLRLRYSDDDGRTWSDYLDSPMGKIGEHTARCNYFALGQSRKRIFELSNSDPVPMTIINAYIEAEVLND